MKIILYKQSFYFLKYFFIVLLDFKYIIGEIVLEKKKVGFVKLGYLGNCCFIKINENLLVY